MKKDLYKVANTLNASILSGICLAKKAADAEKASNTDEEQDRKAAKKEKSKFRFNRNFNRGAEKSVERARRIAATLIGGAMLAGSADDHKGIAFATGAITGNLLSRGIEGLGGSIGRTIARVRGGADPEKFAREDRKNPLLNWKLMFIPGYDKYRQELRKMQVENAQEDLGRFLDLQPEMDYTRG